MAIQLTVCLVILMFLKLSASQQNSECITLQQVIDNRCRLTIRTNGVCNQSSPCCINSSNYLTSFCEGLLAGCTSTTQKSQGTGITDTVNETSTPTTGKECACVTTVTTTKYLSPSGTMKFSCSQTEQKIMVTVTTTVTANTLQVLSTFNQKSTQLVTVSSTFNQTSTQPPHQKTNKDSRSSLAALGVITGILLLSLVGVTVGWIWTMFALKKKLTKMSSPAAVRLQRYTSADNHQQPPTNNEYALSSDHPNVEPANDDYAEVADRLATIHTRYLHREQQPVPRQSRRESTKPLIENEYQIQEQSHERESGVDHDYQILEYPDEEAQEGENENYYHVLDCAIKPSANGETETAATAAALYETPVASKIKSKNT